METGTTRTTLPRLRRSSILLGALVVTSLACGETSPRTQTSEMVSSPSLARPQMGDAPPVERVTPAARARAFGGLERASALHRFFDALVALDERTATRDVRILQFGDSHTAADVQAAAVRHALASRFGDGGRGYVPLGSPWKGFLQEGVRVQSTREWSPQRGKYVAGKFVGDGHYGLSGVSVEGRKRGGVATSHVGESSRIEVSYLDQPRGGSVELYIDGVRKDTLRSKGAVRSQFRAYDLPLAPHQVEMRLVGDGDFRLLGASLDKPDIGIVYDALGINGARMNVFLTWEEEHFAEQIRRADPALVILAYGTNESGDDTSAETLERHMVDALGRIARAVPGASCLLLGPPDRAVSSPEGFVTSPKLLSVIQSQKRVAEAAGCAFYSQFDAMGGEGAIAEWALEDPPRAQKDHVHLTRDGYQQMGAAFASDLLRSFAAYRSSSQPSPTPGDTPPALPALPAP